MNDFKISLQFSSGIFFILIVISMVSISCNKSKDLVDTWAQGVVIDAVSMNPIADATVYLMKNEDGISVAFYAWEAIDSILTDETGSFRFDYQNNSFEGPSYNIYAKHEHHFDYKEVQNYTGSQKREGVNLALFPKAYLQIRVKDEPPYSGYESMHIPTLVGQDRIDISGSPIDTVVTRYLHGNESELLLWFYHDNGDWIQNAASISACNSYETCYFEIIF